jgi:hypothetical protein
MQFSVSLIIAKLDPGLSLPQILACSSMGVYNIGNLEDA